MEKSQSNLTADEEKELYKALDKDEDPPARLDQGMKRQKTSKDIELTKGSKSKESKSTSSSKGSTRSQPKSSGKSAQVEELSHIVDDTEVQQNQGQDMGTCKSRVEREYNIEECYKFVTDQLDWNNPEGKKYSFDLSKPLMLIMDRGRQVLPVDYFINHDLEYLRGGSSTKKYTTSTTKTKAAKYDIQAFIDMVSTYMESGKSNKVSKHDVYSTKIIIVVTKVKVMKWYNYGYLEDFEVRREDQQLYKFNEGDFPRLHLHNIEDMLLLLVQKKLSNIERDVIFDLGVALWMFTRRIVILKRVEDLQLGVESYQKKLNITKPETFMSDISNKIPYTTYNNPQGIIYEDNYKRNRLMRTDELYKFSDGTLTSVRFVLHDIASNLRMDYLPKRRWSSLDRKRSRIMIKAIDKKLLERRLMRSLEKFAGGRDYGEDLRLLQRTI
ncbi:hypothetical protein Tco_0311393 [Tanacetum coccineum]